MTSIDGNADFLAGGGEMGERIRSFPWAGNPLGDPQHWPQGLRTAVRVMLTTQHPVFIFWGDRHTCLYNDAYSRSIGAEKHPSILGAPGRQSWEEIWSIIGPQIEQVMRGEGATWHENQLVPIIRHGDLQDVYWTYSYSPIDQPDAPHGVGGVLVLCSETTEQVFAQRQLLAERERFVQLFNQAPTFLAVLEGPRHVFTFANPAYMKVVGGRPVLGRGVAEALPEAHAQGYVSILDEVYRTGKSFSATSARFELRESPGDAPTLRYVDFIYQPMTSRDGAVTGILVQGVDMTARVATDNALAQNRSRLDYATRLSGIGFWYCDLPFSELEWDDRVKEHFFLSPQARVTIDDFYSRMHHDDRAATRAAIEASIQARTPYDIVYRTVHPDTGAIKWIRAVGGAVHADDGTPARFDGVTLDVSAQKSDELRLSMLNHLLREQDRRKDEFIATLAHELRNPLAPIRSAARILSTSGSSIAQQQQAQVIIERQVVQMSALLDDLLDIARITHGKLKLRKTRMVLTNAVSAAAEALRPQLEARRQPLTIELPSTAVHLEADPVRIAQILTNLLTNASRYSAEGSRISLTGRLEGDHLLLSVRDNGIGIPQESLARIFEMFSQVDGVDSRSEGGLGIGLALVKGLVELHDGRVEARSDGHGQGSEFIVRLPLDLPPEAAKETIPGSQQVRPARRILLADDNRDAVDSVAMLLELGGHEVRVVYLGQEALRAAEAFCPDTVILDIGMPDLTGHQVAEELRRQPWCADAHLIALTGWGQESDRLRARQAGFDHLLVKPVDPDALEQLILQGQKGRHRNS